MLCCAALSLAPALSLCLPFHFSPFLPLTHFTLCTFFALCLLPSSAYPRTIIIAAVFLSSSSFSFFFFLLFHFVLCTLHYSIFFGWVFSSAPFQVQPTFVFVVLPKMHSDTNTHTYTHTHSDTLSGTLLVTHPPTDNHPDEEENHLFSQTPRIDFQLRPVQLRFPFLFPFHLLFAIGLGNEVLNKRNIKDESNILQQFLYTLIIIFYCALAFPFSFIS